MISLDEHWNAIFSTKADMWIDRAVLHFLIEEDDIQGYFANLKAEISPDGYAFCPGGIGCSALTKISLKKATRIW